MNSQVTRLDQSDFVVDKGSNGRIVMCMRPEIQDRTSVCMFYSPKCRYSIEFLPEFERLAKVIGGCRFCSVNVNENTDVIRKSKQTVAPITAVPAIFFYVRGRPFLQYDGENTAEQLGQFIFYALKMVESKKEYIDNGAKVESTVPGYSTHRGYHEFKCDDSGFCYLSQGDAYQKGALTKA